MNIKYPSYILTIAKKENMTKAAEELLVSQSTLNQYLSKLESELGIPFFYRSKGRPTLTAAGRLHIDAAEKVTPIKDNLYQNIQNPDNRGYITIGVASQFAPRMLTELIPPFEPRFPDATIEISETNVPSLTQLILEENIDYGIMTLNTMGPFSRDQAHVFRREEILFVIPRTHPYCRINPGRLVTISEFARYFSEDNILMPERGSTLRCLADQIIEAAGWIPGTMCEINNIIATHGMVAMGIGVTFIGASCAVDREYVSYYPLEPGLYHLDAFVTRRNWVMSRPEGTLCHDILHYFSNQGQTSWPQNRWILSGVTFSVPAA